MRKYSFWMVIAGMVLWASAGTAMDDAGQAGKSLEPVISTTQHRVQIDGQTISYTAVIGKMTVNKPDETPGAEVFFTAYIRDGIQDKSQRPIAFVFNGGPGSSSVWLHMGGIGPKRVRMTEEGFSVEPPYALEDNAYSILDVTDLVFIDPVSTGFSRPLPGEKKSQFHGVHEDLASVGEFIRTYVSHFGRWSSPKFLLGESYGTFRSAGLAGFLQGRQHGMYLNGIILVSSVLDFTTIGFAPGNTLPYVLFLPHYTATARYHNQLSQEMQDKPLVELLDEVEDFALNEYSVALIKGNRLDADEQAEIVRKLAGYTGLSEEYIRQTNLRIRHDRFVKELLRDEFKTVGRLDSRFKGIDADAAGENYEFDPSSAAIQGSFSTMFNEYIRRELGFPGTQAYHIYGNVYPWNFTSSGQIERRTLSVIPNMAETLRSAMSENEFLQVFVANGYYDGATPYFGTEFTFSQIGLNGEFKDRVQMGYYEAGHMMYIHKPSLIKLKADLAAFITAASAGKE